MRYIIFFLLLIVLCCNSYGQLHDSDYIGTATLKSGEILTYKLHLIDSNGYVIGYSIMDLNSSNETKAQITGTISNSGNQIIFKEVNIMSSKTKTDNVDFCLLQGSLKAKTIRGTKILKGHFEGYINGGNSICANGKLVLISPKDIFKLINLNDKQIDSISDKTPSENIEEEPTKNEPTILTNKKLDNKSLKPVNKIDSDEISKQKMVSTEKPKADLDKKQVVLYEDAPKNVQKVSPGKLTEIICSTSLLSFEVWDNKNIDGDVITLMQGSKALIKNYTLTATHYTINLDIGNKQTDTLNLIAVSEGSEPLNTARIRIASGNDIYFIDATTTIDKDVRIIIRKRK